MKTLISTMAVVFVFGTITVCFAGNRPALIYPSGAFSTTSDKVEVTPWQKGAEISMGGIVAPSPWYSYCPVKGTTVPFTQKHPGMEIRLSNGEKMMVCCAPCKDDVEKDLGKYSAFMY